MRATLVLLVLLASSLLGCPAPPPEPDPEPEAQAACCTLEEVIAMHEAGVDEALIITSVQQSENDLKPSAQDLIQLNEAGVSSRVVRAMMGEDPDAAPAPGASAAADKPVARAVSKPPSKPAGPPPLELVVAYSPGSKSFTLTNTGGRTYTGLVLTANNEHVYALPVPLPPGNPDSVRIGSFTSPKTGHKLYPSEGLRTLSITSDQGRWSRSF